MATTIIHGPILWVRDIEGDPVLARVIAALAPGDAVTLRIEGRPVRFRKMRDDRTGAAGDGVRPEPSDVPLWDALRASGSPRLTVEPAEARADPDLLALAATLTEWNSPEDAAAYDGL